MHVHYAQYLLSLPTACYIPIEGCLGLCLVQVKQAAVAGLSAMLPPNQRPLPLSLVRLAPASSCVNPNGGPTWSSTGSEGNCQAILNAAGKVVERLRPSLQVRWHRGGGDKVSGGMCGGSQDGRVCISKGDRM